MLKSALITFGFALALSSCKKKEDNPAPAVPTNPAPAVPKDVVRVSGDITANTTWDTTKNYLLVGRVFVQSGVTLTIKPGVLVMGDKTTAGSALIINRGAKIMAEGTADMPIIMTSSAPAGFRNRGDWGGLIVCGKARNNNNLNSTIEGISAASGENGFYGGTDDADNSGVLKFVRIEFAGYAIGPDNELNSLTLGSVGSGTVMDNIMVSYANDDAYEWFGGTVSHKYLISFSTWDDDFDSDRGYSGRVQYGFIVRDPNAADQSGSRAWESSSASSSTATPQSSPKFANITVFGPRSFSSKINANYQAAIEINTNTNAEVYNSVVTGFPTGIRFNAGGNAAVVRNTIFTNDNNVKWTGKNFFDTAVVANNMNDSSRTLASIYPGVKFDYATVFSVSEGFKITNPVLPSGSPIATGAPDISSMGFIRENYYGAFGTSAAAGWQWGKKWIEFNPVNAVYQK